MLAALGPELRDLRQRRRIRFAAPALMRALIDRRIGVETMDTPAACRTYNVLRAEGRKVVAALLFDPPAPAEPGCRHGSRFADWHRL